MKAILITPVFALIFWSCNSISENLVKLEFNNLNISIMVPQTHSIFEYNDRAIIDLNPDGRTVRQFSISKSKSILRKDKYVESLILDNGATFKYYTFEEGGGSGGIEYELEGILNFNNELFSITSIDQTEGGKGNPKFCLNYLSTIKIINDLPTRNNQH